MRRYLVILVGLMCLCGVAPCLAQRTVAADKPIQVKLEVGQPTSLAFPEVLDSVQAVKFGDRPEDRRLSMEMRGPYCYLILNDETYSGRLFVIGKSGKQYLVMFRAASPADVVLHILPTVPAATKAAPVPVGVPAVLRALWTQTPLLGQQAADVIPPSLPDSRLTLLDAQAMTVAGYIGMLLRVRNTTDIPLALDVRVDVQEPADDRRSSLASWIWPPRLTIHALAAEHETLPPGAETRILVVLQRRP